MDGAATLIYYYPQLSSPGNVHRFERLALEYDSDELGDLDEDEGSMGSVEPFDSILAQQITEHTPAEDVGDEIRQYTTVSDSIMPSPAVADEDARIAVQKVQWQGPATAVLGGLTACYSHLQQVTQDTPCVVDGDTGQGAYQNRPAHRGGRHCLNAYHRCLGRAGVGLRERAVEGDQPGQPPWTAARAAACQATRGLEGWQGHAGM